MATLPTPEELGRSILDLYKQNNRQIGDGFQHIDLLRRWIEKGGNEAGFSSGITWLMDNHFIEMKGIFLCLTTEGFSEM